MFPINHFNAQVTLSSLSNLKMEKGSQASKISKNLNNIDESTFMSLVQKLKSCHKSFDSHHISSSTLCSMWRQNVHCFCKQRKQKLSILKLMYMKRSSHCRHRYCRSTKKFLLTTRNFLTLEYMLESFLSPWRDVTSFLMGSFLFLFFYVASDQNGTHSISIWKGLCFSSCVKRLHMKCVGL